MLLKVQGTPNPKKDNPNTKPSKNAYLGVRFNILINNNTGLINDSHQKENGENAQTNIAPKMAAIIIVIILLVKNNILKRKLWK